MAIFFLMSFAAAIGTGWLIFARHSASAGFHAAFLLAVTGCVFCVAMVMWRVLTGGGRAGGAGT